MSCYIILIYELMWYNRMQIGKRSITLEERMSTVEDNISIKIESPITKEATTLLQELSVTLEQITGSTGNASFDISDLNSERSVFILARNTQGIPIGCGAIRQLKISKYMPRDSPKE